MVGDPAAQRPDPQPTVDVSIVVPTYREAANLRPLVKRVFTASMQAGLASELIVVDDSSDDGTDEVCAALAAEYNVWLITRRGVRGLATAVVDGLAAARGRVLVCLDADLSHPPELIPSMVQAVREGADFVIGSRYHPGGGTDATWGVYRWLNSRMATLLARPLTSVSDPMSGFFALSRRTYEQAAPLAPLGYKIALELLVKAPCVRVVELPFFFADRKVGESKLSLRIQGQYLRHLRRLYRHRYPASAEMVQFAVVGSAGLVVDIAFYSALQWVLGVPHLTARVISFVGAATHNWLLNRRYTFVLGRLAHAGSQWARYVAVMVAGLVVSVGTYVALTSTVFTQPAHRYLALVIGTALGSAFNFLAAKLYVFVRARHSRDGERDSTSSYKPLST
jgi:dolichol-phosphate mannosyltransferase